MNDNLIEIKERRKDWLFKGIFTLVLMLASLFVVLLPLLSIFAKSHSIYFYAIGGVSFALLTAYFVFQLYKECNPNTFMLLNARGFIDRKNVGEDIEIDWTNVASVKILGKTDMPFLGINLENSDIVIARMKKNEADEMRENINENLPAILIAQNEIRIPIKELKDLFTKFVREARALENDIPKKPKNNPFSTDDVLRAFGKLPKEEEKVDNEEPIAEETVEEAVNENAITEEVQEVFELPEINFPVVEEEPTNEVLETEQVKTVSNDSFYETLREKAAANIEVSEPVQAAEIIAEVSNEEEIADLSESDMPDEMKTLLAQAKSTKISELEKILSDNETPFTYARTETEQKQITQEEEPEVNEIALEQAIEIEDNLNIVPTEIQLDIAENTADTEENQFEITLESMIQNALNDESDCDDVPDVIRDVSEASSVPKMKKRKSFVLHEKKD